MDKNIIRPPADMDSAAFLVEAEKEITQALKVIGVETVWRCFWTGYDLDKPREKAAAYVAAADGKAKESDARAQQILADKVIAGDLDFANDYAEAAKAGGKRWESYRSKICSGSVRDISRDHLICVKLPGVQSLKPPIDRDNVVELLG